MSRRDIFDMYERESLDDDQPEDSPAPHYCIDCGCEMDDPDEDYCPDCLDDIYFNRSQ